MTVSADLWQARAAMCELLALSFRYPEDKVLAEAIASGEWGVRRPRACSRCCS